VTSRDVDIFDNPFRDPVYEEMGFMFDPDRNQYYEIVQDPRLGEFRRYLSPRDESTPPELSDARIRSDMIDLMKQVANKKRVGAVTDREALALLEGRMGKTPTSKGLVKGRGFQAGGAVNDVDIFDVDPRPPARPEYIPPQRFDQLQQFVEDPKGFNSPESVERRYNQGRQDILDKREQGGYGMGENFDREAYESDYRSLNRALDMGMPARIFPAFTPYSAREADMAAEIAQYEGIPTPEQMGAEQVLARISADRSLEKEIAALDPIGRSVQNIAGGIGSLLGRVGAGSSGKQFILREEGRGPEIKLFREEGRRGMPSQTGVTVTRRF
jgi:hypothetical protein